METNLGERAMKEEKFVQNRKSSLIGVSVGRNRTVGGRKEQTQIMSVTAATN